MIAIINYGAGNISSVKNMIQRLGYECIVTSSEEELDKAERIILPGVGHFDHGMKNLKETGLIDSLYENVFDKKKPFLGICLGAQLLTKGSEEGSIPGLGWFDAYTKEFKLTGGFKVPHMGWNYVKYEKASPLFNHEFEDPRYYFVHKYYLSPSNNKDVLATSEYGVSFCSALSKNNIFGVQFHPEKSHKYGMTLLNNFITKT